MNCLLFTLRCVAILLLPNMYHSYSSLDSEFEARSGMDGIHVAMYGQFSYDTHEIGGDCRRTGQLRARKTIAGNSHQSWFSDSKTSKIECLIQYGMCL